MPLLPPTRPITLEIPEKMRVMSTHKARNRMKTTIQSAMLNVIFPDGLTGAITITKITDKKWEPSEDIKSIQLQWQ